MASGMPLSSTPVIRVLFNDALNSCILSRYTSVFVPDDGLTDGMWLDFFVNRI